jgi:hypothetical protein
MVAPELFMRKRELGVLTGLVRLVAQGGVPLTRVALALHLRRLVTVDLFPKSTERLMVRGKAHPVHCESY